MDPKAAANTALARLRTAIVAVVVAPRVREIGRVISAGDGIARVAGLPGTQAQELLRFESGTMGIAFNLDEFEVGCVLLGDSTEVSAGDTVQRSGNVVRTPVGNELIGRVIDPLGAPLDGGSEVIPETHIPVERPAPPILSRAPVTQPMATGIKSIDGMIPIGRGQRELIIGDRSTGKTTIALNTILNQTGGDVVCVYVAIGQRASTVARVVETLRAGGAMAYTIVVAADADSPPGMRFIAPYVGCAISEFFAEQGRSTLIVYDDLSKHAETYREISLLLRRPPGREAYPGDIFYLHSRLLERAAQWDEAHGGGSQTALPIIETQAQNISAYIPTNLISITDGQICMDPDLFQSGFLPAVDIGLSVSRVGGKTQIPAMKKRAQAARLAYTQFIELETFAKFGTTLDSSTEKQLAKGRRLRELLKQAAVNPIPLAEQVLILEVADSEALLEIAVDDVRLFEDQFRAACRDRLADVLESITEGGKIAEEAAAKIETIALNVVKAMPRTKPDADAKPRTGTVDKEGKPPANGKGSTADG